MFAYSPRGSPGVVTPYVRKVIICTVQTYSLGILGLKCQGLELGTSNGNASETKANESFDNGVFFDIEAKRTPSIVRKLFSKRSEHIR